MTESMRERMARAIYERDFPVRVRERPWSRQSDEYRDMYRGFVDAILDVLESPSKAVLKVGDDTWISDEQAHEGPYELTRAEWRSMIAAIRQGK